MVEIIELGKMRGEKKGWGGRRTRCIFRIGTYSRCFQRLLSSPGEAEWSRERSRKNNYTILIELNTAGCRCGNNYAVCCCKNSRGDDLNGDDKLRKFRGVINYVRATKEVEWKNGEDTEDLRQPAHTVQ